MGDLLLTPANARRVTDQLSTLRGAAMKMGQLLSMDAGEALPPELSAILGTLRQDARPMPRAQLMGQLDRAWGLGWRERMARFDLAPMAAASIGQVHRAVTKDGRDLAVKVQYPGVRRSIDSDVDNVASLLRISGLVPRSLDVSPLIEEAKRQLTGEADYVREADALATYRERLGDDDRFLVPAVHRDFTTADVLAMDHVRGTALDALTLAPQAERDAVAARLVELVARELFQWGVMQTDPNLANYRVQRYTGVIVLLDFGATQAIPASTAALYRRLMVAALNRDREAIADGLNAMGIFDDRTAPAHREAVLALADQAMAELHRQPVFDFGDGSLVRRLRDDAKAVMADRAEWRLPPSDTLFVQRKLSGTALMAARLKAQVDLLGLMERWR